MTRLWRYHCIYFLKPHDAINDTLTASLMHRMDWSGEITEIGSGDGVFSYIMHGGSFPFGFDRYLLTDLSKQDIYDTHRSEVLRPAVRLLSPNTLIAVDTKESHVQKVAEIGFSKYCCVAAYEALPIPTNSVTKIFYYTPHGLRDHEEAIDEAWRILAPGGSMLILLYDKKVNSSFLFNRLSKFFPGKTGDYFSRLDNGRKDEISRLAKTHSEWVDFFCHHGFSVEKSYSGLSGFAWKMYDIQTRPILKLLIRFFGSTSGRLRSAIKLLWMIIWYPYLLCFYLLFSNEYISLDRSNCYIGFHVRKVN